MQFSKGAEVTGTLEQAAPPAAAPARPAGGGSGGAAAAGGGSAKALVVGTFNGSWRERVLVHCPGLVSRVWERCFPAAVGGHGWHLPPFLGGNHPAPAMPYGPPKESDSPDTQGERPRRAP